MSDQNRKYLNQQYCPINKEAQFFPAPAKLNLSLSIIGQRADGYHLLESVFCFINLNDEVYLLPRIDTQINLHSSTFAKRAEDDLTVKAARLLQIEGKVQKGVDIWLNKRIPIGAGLGGGSSDAATVLLALNKLWQINFSREQLIQLSVRLGADVPFFVFGNNAFVEGIGEKLTKIHVPKKWYVIIYPNELINTAKIFSHKDLTRNSTPSIMRTLQNADERKNDLQEVVLKEYPQVAKALNALKPFGYPIMTGSGSCVFLECDSSEEARKVFQAVSESFEAYCVNSLTEHPLLND
ncbi:4-(cytidine 5'-diphospho)-2-C-methyl-D-erythritol kinase [Neisseria sp. Ec49-e6-T10]|uniref:4-(cytidine 5'-diphospho)-2-C-methyl-D-erythritol kinase n=1 Tax=Neisseria sp. Ec49-e6-T10 TaxID=3140744 RepID=UPI003EBFC20A